MTRFRLTWASRLVAAAALFAALLLAAPSSSASPDATEPRMELPVKRSAAGVVVRAEAGLDDLADRAIEIAPGALDGIARDLHGLPTPPKIEIRLVKQTSDMAKAAPANAAPPEWAVGVAYSSVGIVIVAARREHERLDPERTLRHELAHLALGAALGSRAPRWLDEGFAFLHSADFDMGRARALTGMAWTDSKFDLAYLSRYFPKEKNSASRAYAQAYDFVEFLTRRGRYPDPADDGDRQRFRDFLAAIAHGQSANEAAETIYGSDLRALTDEWFDDLRDRYMANPIGIFGVAIWMVGALLLVLAYIRRRYTNRRILARWAVEEAGLETPPAPVTPDS